MLHSVTKVGSVLCLIVLQGEVLSPASSIQKICKVNPNMDKCTTKSLLEKMSYFFKVVQADFQLLGGALDDVSLQW